MAHAMVRRSAAEGAGKAVPVVVIVVAEVAESHQALLADT